MDLTEHLLAAKEQVPIIHRRTRHKTTEADKHFIEVIKNTVAMSSPVDAVAVATHPNNSPVEESLDVVSLNSTPTPTVRTAGSALGNSPTRSSDDPFVIRNPKKLSATAEVFKPTNGGNSMMAMKENINLPAATSPPKTALPPIPRREPQPDLAAMLLLRIAEEGREPAGNYRSTDTRLFANGIFSWDRDSSRTMEISCDLPGLVVRAAVCQTLTFVSEKYHLLGDSDFECKGPVMYLRFDDLGDAQTIYKVLKETQPDLTIKYVHSSAYGELCTPQRNFPSQEGAIFINIAYPSLEWKSKEAFEIKVRNLLAQVGRIRAWKLNDAERATLCQMILEYANSSHAQKAVDLYNGKETNIGPYYPKMYVQLEPEHVQRSIRSSNPVMVSRITSVDDDDAFLERLTKMATDRTPPTIRCVGQSTFGADRQQNYPAYTGFSPPTPAGSTMPLYHAGNSDPRTPMNRGHMNNLSNYMVSTPFPTPFSAGSSFTLPPPAGFGTDRRSYSDMSPTSVGSPFSRSFSVDTPMPYATPRKTGLLSPFRGFMSPASTSIHNAVEPEKIVAGEDVRTTVMLRNIPNKVTQLELKAFLETTSFGKYDFAYLRIDFSNNCNVGYAFINFYDPMDIIDFYNARAGKRFTVELNTNTAFQWRDAIKSDKISEISYATIQGRDCLIQKFRNSSVMAEAEHCRPKLFYTDADPAHLVGKEEAFPSADNMAKLKRSCENAEHIGLYAPNAGIHYRDEQRRRRSLFDRGTTMAESEGRIYYEPRISSQTRHNGGMGEDGRFGSFN